MTDKFKELSALAKRIVSNDMRILHKAEYVDNSLELTEKGLRSLEAITAEVHMKDLVELAKEDLKQSSKRKEDKDKEEK